MTLLALLTQLALSSTPVHVVPNTPVVEAHGPLTAAEEQRLEVTMREWIGSTNEDPKVEAVYVAIEPKKVDGKHVPALHVYGTVADRARRVAIVERGEKLPGIAYVDDDLTLPGADDSDSDPVATGGLLNPNPDTHPEKALIEKLIESPFVDGRRIVVDVEEDRVVLTGFVERKNEIAEAVKIAERTLGKPVEAGLSVDP